MKHLTLAVFLALLFTLPAAAQEPRDASYGVDITRYKGPVFVARLDTVRETFPNGLSEVVTDGNIGAAVDRLITAARTGSVYASQVGYVRTNKLGRPRELFHFQVYVDAVDGTNLSTAYMDTYTGGSARAATSAGAMDAVEAKVRAVPTP